MFSRRLSSAVALLGLLVAVEAGADPGAPASGRRRHAVYVEVLGKGGLWGAGWDAAITSRLGAGVAASFYVVDRTQVASLSPYLAAYLLGTGRHRWFVHAGPQLVKVTVSSPVPEWQGTSASGIGAELSTGYEYRDRIL